MTQGREGDDREEVWRAWEERIGTCVERMSKKVPRSPFLVHPADGRAPEVTMVDWTGFPLRVGGCLRRADALALLDWRGASGCEGRRRLQEEYVEWRVVRDGDGGLCRVEMTTELSDWWRVLAAHAPAEALRVAAEFADEEALASEALFGAVDPFAREVSPQQREEAFAAQMLEPPGPYNSERALCCMVNPSNSLGAIVALVSAAAFPFAIEGSDGRGVPARQTIPLFAEAAQDGRSSDPLLVERLSRLASEGRLIALDDPVGVFIQGVERTRLRCPDGRPVPAEWFTFERDAGPGGRSARARFQRMTFEVPAGEGLRLSDLVDVATEEPIEFGGQVADLVQLAISLRVSAPNAVKVDTRRCKPPAAAADPWGCDAVQEAWAEFSEAPSCSQ